MNIAVLGAGWWGKNIINTCDALPRVDSVVAFDPDIALREKFASNIKTHFVDDVEAILSSPSIEAVCIATPPQTHFELTQRCLSAGKHVLIEKPPAETAEDALRLGALAQQKRVIYMLDSLFLFLQPVMELSRIVRGLDRSHIRFVQLYRFGDELRREGNGLPRIRRVMFDQGIDVVEDLFFHDAALLLHLFGEFDVASVERQYLYHPTLCDGVRIDLRCGTIPIELTQSWSLTGRRRGMSIYTDETIIEYDAFAASAQIKVHHLEENRSEPFDFPNVPPLTTMIEYFLDAIDGKIVSTLDATFMAKIMNLMETVKRG